MCVLRAVSELGREGGRERCPRAEGMYERAKARRAKNQCGEDVKKAGGRSPGPWKVIPLRGQAGCLLG